MIVSDLATLVKQAVDIVEVVGRVVPLRRSGTRHVGLCPFHHEKTPSFHVDATSQLFHCFGCGAGGDVVSFVMRHHNLPFIDAIQHLADQYHINLPRTERHDPQAAEAARSEQEELYRVLDLAADYFHQQLQDREVGKAVRDYLVSRALPPSLVTAERLGYALPEWDGLVKYLHRRGVPPELAVKAGLLSRSPRDPSRLYDRFRNRLMFPIRDERGRVVAFGGRTLATASQEEPKYLNSPEHPAFQKGRMLYQLGRAREACRQVRQVVLVEGYMDLLAFHAQSFYRVVATLGTALTSHQVRLLARHMDEVVLAYDGDEAGERAMLRALPLFQQEDLAVSCVHFPDGMDPDDFLRARGLAGFEALLQKREELGAFAVCRGLATWDGTLPGKAQVLAALQPIYQSARQPLLRSEYRRLIADRLSLSETAVRDQLQHEQQPRQRPASSSRPGVRPPAPVELSRFHSLEENILRVMIQHPDLIGEVSASGAICRFQETQLKALAEALVQAPFPPAGEFNPRNVYNQLPDTDLKECFTRLLLDPYELSEVRLQMRDWLAAVRNRDHRRRQGDLRMALRQAEQAGDQAQMRKLLAEIQGLNCSRRNPAQSGDNT